MRVFIRVRDFMSTTSAVAVKAKRGVERRSSGVRAAVSAVTAATGSRSETDNFVELLDILKRNPLRIVWRRDGVNTMVLDAIVLHSIVSGDRRLGFGRCGRRSARYDVEYQGTRTGVAATDSECAD